MGRLAGDVTGTSRPRIVDKTGLTGKYTFVLEYYDPVIASAIAGLRRAPSTAGGGAALRGLRSAESSGGLGGAADSQPPTIADTAGGIDIFKAIRQQLGLRLDKTADVPEDVTIVDRVAKLPTEN